MSNILNGFIGRLIENDIVDLLLTSLWETFFMVGVSSLLGMFLGLPIGTLLTVTEKNSLFPCATFNKVLNFIVNLLRSIPFIILMIILYPLSKVIIGTTIGPKGVVIPLSILAAPFIARLVANALQEVDHGLIEASKVMGASRRRIILRVLFPESLPSLINAMTVAVINIIGASAMAGVIGGGGIGDLAIRYGYQRFETDVLIVAVIATVVIVQLIQSIGDLLAFLVRKKRGLGKKY